ncbi:MAG: hypothetical protein G01um101444_181 [Parcubacteria group bacterium Gr01-1014_44]|nr:MAG: hypothetical protein G01um101444_181 [Parcubacteria group bacterium Gr01-1014_44]
MLTDQWVVTNFAYGTGPYLRTTELAIAFNSQLEQKTGKRLKILVPWVYGEKQKKIMLEDFSNYADEIFLDEALGKILASIFYGDSTYEEALSKWVANVKRVSTEARSHLSGKIEAMSLSGKSISIDGKNIVLEINRSPRIRYDVALSYLTTFGYISDILQGVKKVSSDAITIDRELLEEGISVSDWVESNHKIHAVAYPATFSWQDSYQKHYVTELLTPPISNLYPSNTEQIEPGIFVTATGIPGLEKLYDNLEKLGLKLYSNDVKSVPGSIKKLPYIIPNENIIFQFARSGWGSVWLSMISGTPLVMPDFDSNDDPEIYFNNLAVESLGIGIVYRGQTLEEIIDKCSEIRSNSKALCDKILSRWQTLDGNQYCARIFVDDFIGHRF